jgi:O-acetylserine/cysteine efflux transporter
VAVVLALALTGTLLAFWLFAWAQARVPAELAGAFVNLEPLVGALTGAVAFHDVVGPVQALGGVAILAGIALGAFPRRSPHEPAVKRPPHDPGRTHARRVRARGEHRRRSSLTR